jgi:GNAT superfamily N-acetyltransferase
MSESGSARRPQVNVRRRNEADLDRCVAVAQIVHQLDGYPPYLPTDLRTFLVSSDACGAWVAEGNGEIVGHVALHRRSTPAAMAMASEAVQQPVECLGIVARLLVAPSARGHGVGQALLDEASRAAVDLGLWPVLDVVTHLQAATHLYERCGWTRAGEITVHLGDDYSVNEFVYIGPLGPS